MTENEARKILFNNSPIEIIYKTYHTPDFWEFIGECAGDSMTYRVYNNGEIYEK